MNEHNTDFDFCKVISPGIESHMARTGFLQAMELMVRQLECFVQILNLCGTSYLSHKLFYALFPDMYKDKIAAALHASTLQERLVFMVRLTECFVQILN